MSHKINQELDTIASILEQHPGGLSRGDIKKQLDFVIENKTLQRRLGALLSAGHIVRVGDRKASRYYPASAKQKSNKGHSKQLSDTAFSEKSLEILDFLKAPVHSRPIVSYNREFLDNYVPNETRYVPDGVQAQLLNAGKRFDAQLAAGTYARQICQRLLIDLSYNSSRLEGNTYSRLDTQRLIEEGLSAEGKIHEETVMVMNHKEAILFLVENAQDIEIDSFTIRNLHNLLSQDLLANPVACGNIRSIEVNIGQSTYHPLTNPHQLKELFELILLKARKIDAPYEQSFFLLVHLSYLQAFEDVNKRTSRLSCNIPFLKHNLCPLSFVDVVRDDYTAALLAIYELNDVAPMLELYRWAYLRSCQQYSAVKQSLGEIDAFRVQYRKQRKQVMGQIIKQNLHGKAAEALIEAFCQDLGIDEVAKFTAITMTDLSTLHTGAIMGLGITENQLDVWRESKERK